MALGPWRQIPSSPVGEGMSDDKKFEVLMTSTGQVTIKAHAEVWADLIAGLGEWKNPTVEVAAFLTALDGL